RNPDIYGNTSVTIQCYQYGEEDQEHYEYFDYLNNDGQAIDHFDPTSDIDFFEFKRLMQNEWNITETSDSLTLRVFAFAGLLQLGHAKEPEYTLLKKKQENVTQSFSFGKHIFLREI
ncbi:unnamed protein product, partial [Rotaria socialis]